MFKTLISKLKLHYTLPIVAILLVACGNENANRSSSPIESRAIEKMSAREAQLLGLDLKDSADENSQVWAGPTVYSLPDAQKLAKDNNKKVLVDVYTVWCGYCRKMAAETYPSAKVKNAVDDYFYTVRLNAESDRKIIFNGETFTEAELASAFGVSSFPTTLFIDTDGEPLGLQPGFMDANIFSQLLAFIGSNAFKTQTFEDFAKLSAN
jgi:thioredoxin-related protein